MNIASPLLDEEARRTALDAAYENGLVYWERASLVAAVFLVDPIGLGGIHVRGPAGPVRDIWLREVQRLMPAAAPWVIVPAGASQDRLIGGVSIERSLRTGTLSAERGLLSEADGGVAVLRMAERMDAGDAAPIAGALEAGRVRVERSGVSRTDPARFGVIALDEGESAEEAAPENLTERMALTIDMTAIPPRIATPLDLRAEQIATARRACTKIDVPDTILEALVHTAAALQINSLRAPLFCLRAAKALAAFAGREAISETDARTACELVYGPLAAPPPPPTDSEAPPPPQDDNTDDSEDRTTSLPDDLLEDQLIEAVQNAALLGALQSAARADAQRRAHGEGRSGAKTRGGTKGRPDRPRPASGRRKGRIDLLSTLRAAAPWQKLRGRSGSAFKLRASDLHVKHHRHRAESSVIFVVDASGSAALNRIAEVKGAIEVLLSECYARRDFVSLIAFRGQHAETLLAPTRSLTRVRRTLASLPAGGTTPLADGLSTARALADLEITRGRTPLLVILSDGRGNVSLDGSTERDAAMADTEKAARLLRGSGAATLFFDTSRRPAPRARALSDAMDAAYAPLPAAKASQAVATAVRSTIGRR
ncbi:MAG: magnesium chelatase subunit D [Pseudomonadota bacterium]